MANRQPFKFPRTNTQTSAKPFGNLRPAKPVVKIDPALLQLGNPDPTMRPARPKPAKGK
jgi:hypothetical protein